MRPQTLVGLLLFIACSLTATANEKSEDWTIRDAKDHCEDLVFGSPLDLRQAGGRGLVAVLRVTEGENERQVILRQDGDDQKVETLVTVGGSLRSQLAKLDSKKPQPGLQEACEALHVQREPARSAEGLEALVQELLEMVVPPTIGAPLVLDGTYYRLWIFYAPVNFSYFEFFGAGEDTVDENPLQGWADRLLATARDASPAEH